MVTKKFSELGNKFGKPDIERLGLFTELPHMNGKGYVSPFKPPKPFKGLNMLPGGPKLKTGLQDCYIDKEFKRLFIGESLKGRGRKPQKPAPNISTQPFMPPIGYKRHSTPGDHYGTFGGKFEAMDNRKRKAPPYKREPLNFTTKPGRLGGPGYPNICLNPYPTHSENKYNAKAKYKEYGRNLGGPIVAAHYPRPYFGPDPYKQPEKMKKGPLYAPPKQRFRPMIPPGIFVPTGPAKRQGGCHAGCFDKFPAFKPDRYKSQYEVMKPKKDLTGAVFLPQAYGLRSYYTVSVINENMRFRMNGNNYKTYEPTYTKYLLK